MKEVLVTESTMENDADVGAEPLCQEIIKTGIATDMKKVAKLLVIKSLLKSCNCQAQVTFASPTVYEN